MSKKSSTLVCRKDTVKIGQDILDIQYDPDEEKLR